jgi:hypothetical protein
LFGIDKHKRDLIIYFLWNKRLMTNEQLGRIFNISHSAISHTVRIFKEKMMNDKKVKNQFDKFNSQFNGLLPIYRYLSNNCMPFDACICFVIRNRRLHRLFNFNIIQGLFDKSINAAGI